MSKKKVQLIAHKSQLETMTKNPDLTILKSFLQTCMNLLRDQKAVEGLQELIDNCTGN